MLPLLAPQEYFCPSHTSSRPHKPSRAARVPHPPPKPHPGPGTWNPSLHLSCRQPPRLMKSHPRQTPQIAGPPPWSAGVLGRVARKGGGIKKEGFRALPGSLQGPLHFQGHMSFLTPQSPKCTHTNPRRSPSDHVGLPLISKDCPQGYPLPKGPSGFPIPLPSWPCSQASGPWPEAESQGPSIAKAKGAALLCSQH